MQPQLLSNLEERLGTAWIECKCFVQVFSRYTHVCLFKSAVAGMVSARERGVCAYLCSPTSETILKPAKTRIIRTAKFGSVGEAGNGFQPILAHLSASHLPRSCSQARKRS